MFASFAVKHTASGTANFRAPTNCRAATNLNFRFSIFYLS